MYLSRLTLDSRHRQVRRDLRNCHELHRTLLSAFPDAPGKNQGARAHFGLLYRRESHPTAEAETILMQSVETPDWTRLPPGYCASVEVKKLLKFFELIQKEQNYRFRLRANPTRKTESSQKSERLAGIPKKNGKRRQLYKEHQQIIWLQRKASQAGFILLSVQVVKEGMSIPDVLAGPEGNLTGKKTIKGSEGSLVKLPLTLFSVLFEGRLQVTDADLFRKALQEGIGSGKAYGFGLLSIAPIH